jgi:hypothetical protein
MAVAAAGLIVATGCPGFKGKKQGRAAMMWQAHGTEMCYIPEVCNCCEGILCMGFQQAQDQWMSPLRGWSTQVNADGLEGIANGLGTMEVFSSHYHLVA